MLILGRGQAAPRQESVLKYVTAHPGATLNEIFHDLRAHETGITYESVRAAVGKLIAAKRLRRDGAREMYCSPLYATTMPAEATA